MRIHRVISLFCALSFIACGGEGARGDGTVSATFDIQQAPADAVCVQLTVTGSTRTTNKSFSLTSGQATTTLTATGVPTGAVVITGNAYGVSCASVTGSTQVTWVVTALNATFTVAGPNAATLTLTRNGLATLTFDFQDDQRTTLTLAGGTSGTADGTGAAARFTNPSGTALDGAGNLYISDTGNSTIRKLVIATGAVTTLAGTAGSTGSTDGTGAAARFSGPKGLACDGANLYVADSSNCTLRKIVLATSAVTTIAGQAPCSGVSVDGAGATARFVGPLGLALDGSGNLYVADSLVVRQVVLASAAVTTLAGTDTALGYVDGSGAAARFNSASGIAVDGGALWIADSGNNVIRKLTLLPGVTVSTIAGSSAAGELDGVGTAAQLNTPQGLVADGRGNLLVTDLNGNTVRRVVESSGVVVTVAGSAASGAADGQGAAASFNGPAYPSIDAAGNLYLADLRNNSVRKL